MKRRFILIALCAVLLLNGCSVQVTPASAQFLRIDLNGNELDEDDRAHLKADTVIQNNVSKDFPETLPIYQIAEKEITEQDFDKMVKAFDQICTGSNKMEFSINKNTIKGVRATGNNQSFEKLEITEAELEQYARQLLDAVPFLEGDYEYLGITGYSSQGSDLEEMTQYMVTVSFATLLDDIRVVSGEIISFSIDKNGLYDMTLVVYDYEKMGTMALVPFNGALDRINNPDDFLIDTDEESTEIELVDMLQVDSVNILLINQYYRGCTILQPVYNFVGTATGDNGITARFHSRVIAIPESYTYEKGEEK